MPITIDPREELSGVDPMVDAIGLISTALDEFMRSEALDSIRKLILFLSGGTVLTEYSLVRGRIYRRGRHRDVNKRKIERFVRERRASRSRGE